MENQEWIECTHEDLELHTRIRPKVFDNGVYVVDYEVRALVHWDGLKFRRPSQSHLLSPLSARELVSL